jgi:heptosyltransferase-2
MVIAQSLYRDIRARQPDVEMHVLAPAWSLPLLARMPEVTGGIELAVGHGELAMHKRWRLGKQLRAAGYAQAIVLPRSLKAALVPLFAKIPQRTGFLGEQRYGLINDVRPFDKRVLDQTVKRFLTLGLPDQHREIGTILEPRLQFEPANGTNLLREFGLDAKRPLAALMPGAEYGPAKQWPLESFRELAHGLADAGCAVCILGSDKEVALGDAISRGLNNVANLCGKTSLCDAVDLLAASGVAVSNDSGLMHIGAAVGTEVVALYGSSSPSFTPPLTQKKTILYRNLSCSPCFARHCPLGHHKCMLEISSADVLRTALERLKMSEKDPTYGISGKP